MRGKPGDSPDLSGAIVRLFTPSAPADWIRLAGLAVIGLVCAGASAAYLAARHGLRRD